MDRLLTPRAFTYEFRFSVLCGLFILGLLCVQSAGTTSRSSPCDLSRQFPCRTSPHICIELNKIRDGRSDCPDGSDEECPEGMHRCFCGLPRCIERNKVGDGIKHCQDGSDEGEDGSNYLCPESSGEENLFAIEMKKRRRRHTAPRNDPVVYPTGLISTFVGTEVNGDQTTLHTTQRYRTYVDGSYTELLQSTSMVIPTPTLDAALSVEATADIHRFGSLNSGKVYLTAVNEPVSSISSESEGPIRVSGTFIPPEGQITTKHFGLDLEAKTIGALKTDIIGSSIITVTGTKGTFISPESTTEHIFPVYTGSYISGLEHPTTYKFFFGNHPLTSNVQVILPTATKIGVDESERYEAEESELQASVTERERNYNRLADLNEDKYDPQPFYRSQNKSPVLYHALPTSLHDTNPIVVTRFVQPTAYPETNEPVMAIAGRNTIGVVGNIRKQPESSTLRGHHGHYRQGRMYNPSPSGRRIGSNGATVVADQYLFPGHRIDTLHTEENEESNIRDYYDINGERLQDELRKIVQPTATYGRNNLRDSRLTRTVGLYGPIYEFDDLKTDTKVVKTDTSLDSTTDISENDDTEDSDFTTTLYGFAEFSTRISGTQYIFLPASTRPRTFTPRVTRTSFTNGIPLASRSKSASSKIETITEGFFRKPLFGTETREFISQNSMFTSTIKDPIEIQKTMFTSTVMTKQISDTKSMSHIFDNIMTKSSVAETLPLNLDKVYESESLKSRHSDDRDLFLNFKPIRNHDHLTSSTTELDVSEIFDAESAINIEPAYPTGLVSSITGTEVSEGTTTHWTTLVFGTYIDNNYAHVIESTSSIFFTVSKTVSPEETLSMEVSNEDDSYMDSTSNKFHREETFSSEKDIELMSSLTELSSSTIMTSNVQSNVLATPSLEILTSGFILPRSGRNNDFDLTSSIDPTSSVMLFTESSELSEPNVSVDPGVVYIDNDESENAPESETSDEDSVHILTDSFILPGGINAVPSLKHEEKSETEIEETDPNLNSKITSTYLNDLDSIILGSQSEKSMSDHSKSSTDESSNIQNETKENERSVLTDEIMPKIVYLTGDFILPSASVNEELSIRPSSTIDTTSLISSSSILTDGFILPSLNTDDDILNLSTSLQIDVSPTKSSLSILTDGFILPGVNKAIENSKTSMQTVNILPSSALLVAEKPSDEDLNEIGGRNAGDNEKTVVFDSFSNKITTEPDVFENENDVSKQKLSSSIEDASFRLGKALYSIEESKDKPKADEILPSISFPITYFTTSTYFTTYLVHGNTIVSSRKETVSHIYTDSEHLKLAKLSSTETIIMPDTIEPTKTKDSVQDITTFTYYTTFYKDGTKIVSSRAETDEINMKETSSSVIESRPEYAMSTYPTTYYTTLTYFTTLLKGSTSEVISSETVVSNVVTPVSGFKESIQPRLDSTMSYNNNLQSPTTYFTTFTYYTTFHKDGTTSVSTNYQTASNVIYGKENIVSTPVSSQYKSDISVDKIEYTPTTFYTTYTYYTTYLRGGTPVVSSREEIVSNIGRAKTTNDIIATHTIETEPIPRETTYYTTYTYYTTLLKEGTTTVSTRKETISNIIQSTTPSSNNVLMTPLISLTETLKPDIHPSPLLKSYFTTYTYYTTFLRDGIPEVSTRESTVTNVITDDIISVKPTSSILPTRSFTTYFTTLTSFYTLFNAEIPSVSTVYSTLTDVVALETSAQDFKTIPQKEELKLSPSVTTYYTTYTYFTTLLNYSQPVVSTKEIVTSNVITLGDAKPISTSYTVTPFLLLDSEKVQPTAVLTKTYYTTYTFFTTYLSKGTPSVSTRLETVTNFITENVSKTQNQLSEILLTNSVAEEQASRVHGNLGEIHPILLSPSLLDTSFTTNTIESSFLETNSHDVLFSTKLKTTNGFVNDNTIIAPSTVVNTIYTTFTYYTTLFPNGAPLIETRYETKSNTFTLTITPTVTTKATGITSDLEAAEGGLHENRVQPTPVTTYYTTHTYITTSILPDGGTGYITRQVVATATIEQDENKKPKTQISDLSQCCSETTKYPYTFYTTYTYYTTRFHGDKPTINTRYQTITNVIKAPATAPLTTEIKLTSTIDPIENLYPANHIPSTTTTKINSGFTSIYDYADDDEKKSHSVKSRKDDIMNGTTSETGEEISAIDNVVNTENDINFEKSASTHAMLNTSVTEIPFDNSTENIFAVTLTTDNSVMDRISNITDTSSEILAESNTEGMLTLEMKSTTQDFLTLMNSTEETSSLEVSTENITENETTTVDTTTILTTEVPVRSIFSRRRNRPQYKPKPSFRASSTTPVTTLSSRFSNRGTTTASSRFSNRAATTATTARPAVIIGRRNATRLIYRRPSLAPRINPLQRLRPFRTTSSPVEINTENKRKRRSFFSIPEDYDLKPRVRKILSTFDDNNEGILKNNDLISGSNQNPDRHDNGKENHPLGLIRSMEAKAINNGVTTIYGTEIHGTFINGVYAQVVQSKVRVYSDTPNEIATTPFFPPSSSTVEKKVETQTNKVGLVSSKISTAVRDYTTTVYTTNVYGTYIGDVYAHLAQTTSNIITPTPTVQNPYPTGLISSSIRSDENYGTTTLWTTHVYGTFVNNYYAHIASTFSNVFVGPDKNTPSITQATNPMYAQATPDLKILPSPRSVDSIKEYKTGLLSSLVSEDETDGTTTQYITNIYGTYIGQQYAKHAQTTSKVFLPTTSQTATRSVGLLSSLVNSVINGNTATIYKTEIFGTYIGQLYAQLARTSTDYSYIHKSTQSSTVAQITQKTGLLTSSVVRSEINSGTTTMHINEIYGTYIGNAYAHIAKSTSKVIKPSQSESKTAVPDNPHKTGLISSSVKTEVNDGTTTLHIAEVHGTYVGNYYAHVARRTTTVLPYLPTPTSSLEEKTTSKTNLKSEGVISSEIKTEVNQGTTTLHTREIHGTFINGFYAHVARSSSNVITPSITSSTSSSGLVSAITNSEINNGILTLHTTEIYGTVINGFYAHIARSTSNVISTSTPLQNYPDVTSATKLASPENPLGVISATTSTEINNGDTTVYRTSVIGLETDGSYVQSVKVTSSIIYASHFFPESSTIMNYNEDSKTASQIGIAKDDLDTARVNELDNGNQYISLTEDSDLGVKTPLKIPAEFDILSPSVNSEDIFIEKTNAVQTETFSVPISSISSFITENFYTPKYDTTSEIISEKQQLSSNENSEIQEPTKVLKKEEKSSKEPSDDYNDYNDFVDNKTFRDKDTITLKPNVREQNPRKNKAPTLSSSRKAEPNDDYDEYAFADDYDGFEGRKYNRKPTPSLSSPRFKNTRESKRKSATYGNGDYDEYDDYDYQDGETAQEQTSKSSETATKESVSSSVRIRPFTGRGRPTYTTSIRSSSRASFTIQFRRPSRTRNSRAFGHRSDSENDFDDEINEDEEEGDIEASEAVVTTATPQALSFNRRKPFGSSRYQPAGRNSGPTSTTRPLNVGRNRRPFGRSTPASPSPTPSLKDTVPDYDENTTEDDEFDDYDDFSDKKDPNRNRNFRSTRRPPSRITRFGERRSASNKRGSFRHREDEETENDDFDATTPNYRNSRNRINQRKPSRGRNNRNNSPLLKSSFNSVSRDEEDEDSQSLQPINRIRGNNRNRRPSYNPRTRRPSKTATETPTNKKPYLTVTSVVTTVKTLPIYHGFRTSYATLTTTALDTSIINPSQYTEIENDGVTKTVFYSKTGYPDGIENHYTTITEVVITTTSLASVKLVPIKIGFSTRTDTITDIQVLTTLSTLYSTIMPDIPQPTAFPQQFQPNFFPQYGHQNPDFGLLASANSFVTTQIVTSTTVVPIILRGRTILSTLTTTSTAESTVVQTVQLPQVPSPAPYIPQPYFAFQPLTTLLTLYVTGEHGELKPVVTTVTVPLYQQPVFHTKVARSLQQNAITEHTLKTADIMDLTLSSSVVHDYSREVDIDTHYDKLLSSGLEEINDLFEKSGSQTQTDPLDSTRISNNPNGITTYDVTTISKGPLTEIYEQKVTVNINPDDESMKQNEIDRSKDIYGLESHYSFRKLNQFIEEEQIFRPQRDFTRLRRPPPGIILATVPIPNEFRQPSTQTVPVRSRSQQFVPPRRSPAENFNSGISDTDSFRNGLREPSFARRPLRRPAGNFRPFIEIPSEIPLNTDEEIDHLIPSSISTEPIRPSFSLETDFDRPRIQNTNRNLNRNNFNDFVRSPNIEGNDDGFQPISNPRGLRRGPAPGLNELNINLDGSLRSRRLRITRPLNGDVTSGVVRRLSRVRSTIVSTPSPSVFENDITSSFDAISSSYISDSPDLNHTFEPSNTENVVINDAIPLEKDTAPNDDEENISSRRTVIRRLRPTFIPGDGSGNRRPLIVRRTRINDQLVSSTLENTISETPVSSTIDTEISTSPVTELLVDEPFNIETDDTVDEENINSLSKPPVKKIIRVRKPENGDQTQTGPRRKVVVSRKPQDILLSNTLQARGPVNSIGTINERNRNNIISDKNHLIPDTEHDIDDFNKIIAVPDRNIDRIPASSTKAYPITYYTTLTYFTTFLHGPETNYASRIAVFSNVIDQTVNPSLINAIKMNLLTSAANAHSTVHLASRTLGDTTTVVNLASSQNVYNSELITLLNERPNINIIKPTSSIVESTRHLPVLDTSNINVLATLPKTYLTLFTYSYTFFDGINRRESTRAETMTKLETDPTKFLKESIGSYIDKDGLLTVLPVTRTLHLGSREVEGTTTEVNLGLKTLIKIDNVKDVVLETVQPFQYITATRMHPADTFTHFPEVPESPVVNTMSRVYIESSYASANDLFGTNNHQDISSETTPLVSSELPNNPEDKKSVIKVTSIIHKSSSPLRSGTFNPRPGVRVRVRPVVSRRLVPSDLVSSFDISYDVNEIASEYPGELPVSPQYILPGMNIGAISTPVLEEPFLTNLISSDIPGADNELVSEDFDEDHMSATDGVQPSRKKLKVTVRRPQSESVSRSHTRFVLPSRFEITSKPKFYVVTRTGALGVVSNSQRPFTVKISRKLKPTAAEQLPPSTTVIYDTYTTLTTVPVIFGLETSFRNVILTTSSPITVSFVPSPIYETDVPEITPSSMILTYFTTTTYTIPYIVEDETLFTTLEETNSRVVTSTLDVADSPALTVMPETEEIPDHSLYTSIEFGFDGLVTHTLSSDPLETIYEEYPVSSVRTFFETSTPTLYEAKTFFTTYTFFTTLFAGNEPVVSSSEQVISNIVTVPVTTQVPQSSPIVPDLIEPVTMFDTSETVITQTNYNTVTFYATLFSDTSSFVTPIQEVQTDIRTITETFTITRTILPTPVSSLVPETTTTTTTTTLLPFIPEPEPSVVVTQTLYTTFTNFVTLFQGSDTVVTNLEEIISNVVTMTVPAHAASSFTISTTPVLSDESQNLVTSQVDTPVYTTREVVSTQTHYLTLFNNDASLLSSIEEIVTSYVTELATPSPSDFVPFSEYSPTPEILLSSEIIQPSSETFTPFTTSSEESTTEISTYHPELVPSIRTIYSTLTFYTTYYSDTSSIVATQEEVLTSYVTLFVPPSLITSTSETSTEDIKPTSTTDPSVFVFTTTDYSTLTLYTTLFSGDEIVVISSEHVVPEIITATITPTSNSPLETATKDESVLTFLTTFTYYTTYFSGTDPVIASSESVVTQYVTIEAPISTADLSIQPTSVDETIIGVSTASDANIVSSFNDIPSDIKIIGVSSDVATGTAIESRIESNVQVESNINTHIGFNSLLLSPVLPSTEILESPVFTTEKESTLEIESSISKYSEEELVSMTPNLDKSAIISETSNAPFTSTSILSEKAEIVGTDGKITSLGPSDTLLMITGTDGFITKMAEIDTAALSPVYVPPTEQPSSASSSEIKPATVIELSDLLSGNTAFGGDIGLAIKDIVSLITGKKNKTEETTTTESTIGETEKDTTTVSTTETSEATTEGTTEKEPEDFTESTTHKPSTEKEASIPKDIDYPIFVLPNSEVTEEMPSDLLAPVYIPIETRSTLPVETLITSDVTEETKTRSSKSSKSVSTSIITGARTVFIVPNKASSTIDEIKNKYVIETEVPKIELQAKSSKPSSSITEHISVSTSQVTKQASIPSYRLITETSSISPEIKKDSVINSHDTNEGTLLVSSMASSSTDDLMSTTPELKPSIGTKVVSGARTVFFDSALKKSSKTRFGILSTAKDAILGRANAAANTSKSFTTLTKDGQTVVSRSTSGATTIFFPGQIPKYTVPVISTRYVTSVESITRTLALTTTRTYYTRDSTLTVPSVYTTTIPPRTFVSTIIGSRTILGILPEPSETVQIHKTQEPSEHTTTVTTTTLIFNSIPSTVTRTLVLPTGALANTIRSHASSSYTVSDSSVYNAATEKPAKRPEVGDSTAIVIEEPSEVKESAVRPVQKARDETYLRAANPRIHDDHQHMRIDDEVHRPPIVLTEATRPEDDPFLNGRNGVCDPKCQPYKKEICKENDGFWTCQCRPGHARRDEHEICKEIQTFVVLLKVVKMGNESIQYNESLVDNQSPAFKEFAKSVREGIADAYSITNVKDHVWDAEVNEVIPVDPLRTSNDVKEITTVGPDSGVIVNFTVQVSKSVSGNLLEQELTRALQLTNMRIGDSSLLAAPLSQSVQDYDECLNFRQNDCSLRALCVNLDGTFTCECNEGFEDMDPRLPGRICLAKTENCDYCHGRGDCLRDDEDKTFCRCQPMFVGRRCEVNGLVLAVALPTAVAVVILLLCAVLCCCRKCRRKSPKQNTTDPGSVFRGIALKGPIGGTLDRKAMIDTSSESSGEHGRKGQGSFNGYQESGDVTPHKSSKRSDLSLNRSLSTGYTSPPVMIPRAKQPQVPNKPMNYTVYDGQVYVW